LKPDEFELTGSREVLVSREHRQVGADEILACIQRAANEQSPEQDVELEFAGAQSPVSLPPGECELQVSKLTYYGNNAACTVTFQVAGVPVKTARYTLKALHFGEALVATRNLDKGSILVPDDLMPQRVKLTPGRQLLLSGDEYVGSQVVSRIAAGEPVPARSIAMPVLVQKGSQVTLRARVGGCEVTCAAIAMQDGRAGQIVRLKADHTEKPLTGRVTGPQQADALVIEGGN
jgi:flagella basal body P-ring formation protein FlgA